MIVRNDRGALVNLDRYDSVEVVGSGGEIAAFRYDKGGETARYTLLEAEPQAVERANIKLGIAWARSASGVPQTNVFDMKEAAK